VCHDDSMAQSVVTVLVIDDQAPFREVAEAVVDATPGFELIGEAESGQLGVEKVASLAPDLVLMDIHMAGMSGVEAATRIADTHPNTVVFLVSTYQAADLPASTESSGAAAYIHKEELGPRLLSELWATHGAAA
jgi:DNA-binding NarL/FixJ family response regulator